MLVVIAALGFVSVFAIIISILYRYWQHARSTTFLLHGYQKDFLDAMAAAGLPAVQLMTQQYGLKGATAALQAIVMEAIQDASVQAEIFDDFHCVHCGSKNPAAWIKDRKGQEPHSLVVTKMVKSFLSMELLVAVEKLGTPPVRQIVVEKPRHADSSKAARCCIDWAIKKYDAVADGKPKLRPPASPAKASSPTGVHRRKVTQSPQRLREART